MARRRFVFLFLFRRRERNGFSRSLPPPILSIVSRRLTCFRSSLVRSRRERRTCHRGFTSPHITPHIGRSRFDSIAQRRRRRRCSRCCSSSSPGSRRCAWSRRSRASPSSSSTRRRAAPWRSPGCRDSKSTPRTARNTRTGKRGPREAKKKKKKSSGPENVERRRMRGVDCRAKPLAFARAF